MVVSQYKPDAAPPRSVDEVTIELKRKHKRQARTAPSSRGLL